MYVKLENENRFVKNITNNSLINTDIDSLKEYKSKKELASKVNDLSGEINNMKNDISDIKSLLQQLVNSSSEK
jgi:uncharacterized coiled-coil DUF342 family protein